MQDLAARLKARGDSIKSSFNGLTQDDSYNASLIAMPFQEFIHHPLAHDLVHNGATFQVAGLTNKSYSENAAAIRQCVITYPWMGKFVLEVAKKRLDNMLYVMLTDLQTDSMRALTELPKDQISMEAFMKNLKYASKNQSVISKRRIPDNSTSLSEFKDDEVMEEIVSSYKECVKDLRDSQRTRKSRSLKSVKPIDFSGDMRKFIPKSVIEEVVRLNSLDEELFKHAEALSMQQMGKELFQDLRRMDRENSNKNTDSLDSSRDDSRDAVEALMGLTLLWLLMVLFPVVAWIGFTTRRYFTTGLKKT
jgi:hypothetical protein